MQVRGLHWLSDMLNKISRVAITLLLIWVTIVLTIQIGSRYLLATGMSWTEEMARYSLIWIVFLGAAVVTKEKDHISVPILETAMPSLKKYFKLIQGLIFLVYIVIVLGVSWGTLQILQYQSSANMGLSMALVYSVIPISFILIFIHLLASITGGDNKTKES
jgi:TRAP-type C4-dicarboxylate transport system permease small subunit